MIPFNIHCTGNVAGAGLVLYLTTLAFKNLFSVIERHENYHALAPGWLSQNILYRIAIYLFDLFLRIKFPKGKT